MQCNFDIEHLIVKKEVALQIYACCWHVPMYFGRGNAIFSSVNFWSGLLNKQ